MHANNHHQHVKSCMQQDIMKLHEILVKFHIRHVQNEATVQPQQPTQVLFKICPKQQHSILPHDNNKLQDSIMYKQDMGL